MPIDASIPLQVQQPDMLKTISNLLTVQGQQSSNRSALAKAKEEEQTQRQRSALASYDWSQHIGEDGTIDLNTLNNPELRKAAGDQFPELLSKMMGVKQQHIAAKQSLVNLKTDQRSAWGSMVGALRSDPDISEDTPAGRAKVNAAMAQFSRLYGSDVDPILKAYGSITEHTPPGKLGNALQTIQLQATSAENQATRQAPQFGYKDTGPEEIRVQTNAYAPGGADVPEKIKKDFSPTERYVLGTNAAGQSTLTDRQTKAIQILGQDAPAANPTNYDVHALGQQATKNFENISATRQAASTAPQQINQIDKALDISRQVSTGKWASERGAIESGLSGIIPGLKSANDDATKLDLLNKFSERIAADANKVLGPNANTDAARESIRQQNANTGYTPKAIQEVLKYAKAQTMAMEAKGNAQEKWLTENKNNITEAHKFETDWRKAYDPRIFQYVTMDTAEKEAFRKSLNKEEAKDIAEKTRRLRELGAL